MKHTIKRKEAETKTEKLDKDTPTGWYECTFYGEIRLVYWNRYDLEPVAILAENYAQTAEESAWTDYEVIKQVKPVITL